MISSLQVLFVIIVYTICWIMLEKNTENMRATAACVCNLSKWEDNLTQSRHNLVPKKFSPLETRKK